MTQPAISLNENGERKMIDTASELRDALYAAHDAARDLTADKAGMVGYGYIHLLDGSGATKAIEIFANLITDTGDGYYAAKAIVGISPANASAPTALTGMQIGSGSTAVAKAGAGGAMVTLLAGQAFDASYPQTANLGAGLGVNAVYKTTYAAGTGTGTVQEATITNGTIGTASTVANTIARVTFTSVVKAAGDSLAITWNHKFLGA